MPPLPSSSNYGKNIKSNAQKAITLTHPSHPKKSLQYLIHGAKIFFQATEAELSSFSPDDIKDFTPPQVVEFLAQLVDEVKSR